jgi:hypothetical protein
MGLDPATGDRDANVAAIFPVVPVSDLKNPDSESGLDDQRAFFNAQFSIDLKAPPGLRISGIAVKPDLMTTSFGGQGD